jgi:membrane-bound lytic murein transglycosylase D
MRRLLLTSSFFLFTVFYITRSVAQEIDETVVTDSIEAAQVVENETKLDYIPEFTSEEVKERLAKIESSVKLTYNDKIAGFINYFAVRNRDYTRLMIQRKNLYFPIFEKALARYGMPDEIKYLAIVESGLNPKVSSRVGAIGLWQFMPRTGRDYGLKYDLFIDEKMDPVKSTEAACKYLSDLYGMFHDWQLALASYNCGPGSLRRAIRKSGYKGGFWGIYDKLPRETRAYVPQFIAIMYVMNYAREHNLQHDNLDFPMETDTVLVNRYLDLEKFAKFSDICLEDIQKLNPELKRNAVPDYIRNYPLKIPADKKEYFALNRSMIFDSASKATIPATMLASYNEEEDRSTITKTSTIKTKVYHTVKSGEVLGSIATKHGVRIADIRSWNRIKGNVIRRGQKLVIYKYQKVKSTYSSSAETRVASATTPKPTKAPAEKEVIQQPKNKFYIVQPGDTLWRITQKHEGLTIEQLKRLNNLKDSKIKPGMKLVVG